MPVRRQITGYSDGACKKNPGRGGWGCLYTYEGPTSEIRWSLYGGKKMTTNQEMELTGMFELLRLIPAGHDITLKLDSTYVLNGLIRGGKNGQITDRNGSAEFTGWVVAWLKNNWKKTDGSDVRHKNLWMGIMEQCHRHIRGGSTLNLVWVEGHANCEGNILADQLANLGVPI